ncbi:Hypothetical predicted protein [Cloeon dipterum]|nr:Hypothetical predicted protein [Cloeon dipterum]
MKLMMDNVDMMGYMNDYGVVDSSGEMTLTSSTTTDDLKMINPVVENKSPLDSLDTLLTGHGVNETIITDLKPLPPFNASYTGQVRLNYQHRANEFYAHSPQQHQQQQHQHQQQIPSPNSGVVGSTNRLEANNNNNSNVNNNNNNNNVYKNCGVTTSGNELFFMTEPVTSTVDAKEADVMLSSMVNAKEAEVMLGQIVDSDIEDFAAIIGNVMADTTVNMNRESWIGMDEFDFPKEDYLQEMTNPFGDCSQSPPSSNPSSVVSPPSSSQQQPQTSSTLQSLLTQGTPPANYQAVINSSGGGVTVKREPATYHHMPLLQSRLQNGAMMPSKDAAQHHQQQQQQHQQQQQQQQQQFLPYCGGKDMLPHTTLASPPGHVSTSELINGGGPSPAGRFNNQARGSGAASKFRTANNRGGELDSFGVAVPVVKKTKSRSKSKLNAAAQSNNAGGGNNNNPAAGLATYPDGSAKEKPVHHCTMCNRGFLNKSNIKVHMRTHTGEKPFRCEVCSKAFRQKAHLIKHQQIHRRVGRD